MRHQKVNATFYVALKVKRRQPDLCSVHRFGCRLLNCFNAC
nr:MAG TPA: hypothetical protein [Caudoviricetes sp.]